MSDTLYRYYARAEGKHIYRKSVCDTSCEYYECFNRSNGEFGVYCDSTFYPRCWDVAAKNWKVEVPCCGVGKTFIDVVANWVAWEDFRCGGVQRICSKSITLTSGSGYDCSDSRDLWFTNLSADYPFNLLFFDFSSGDVYTNVLNISHTGCVYCQYGTAACSNPTFFEGDNLMARMKNGLTCLQFLSGDNRSYSCDILGDIWSLDFTWSAAYD